MPRPQARLATAAMSFLRTSLVSRLPRPSRADPVHAVAWHGAVRRSLPIGQRPIDLVFPLFFLVNLGFITCSVDLEQLVIPEPEHFSYRFWPPGGPRVMLTNVTIVLFEELAGPHATPHPRQRPRGQCCVAVGSGVDAGSHVAC